MYSIILCLVMISISGTIENISAEPQRNGVLEVSGRRTVFNNSFELKLSIINISDATQKSHGNKEEEPAITTRNINYVLWHQTRKREINTTTQHNNTNTNKKLRKRITPIMFMVPRSVGGDESKNNVCSDSEEDFPIIFTEQQLANGAVAFCFIVGIYCFTFLAVVCDKYFLPCVEKICEALNLPQDVAGATFMSMATSAPELFVNVVGTFITESDIGIGTVVGSNLYNTLGVAALGSLAASSPIQLDWWPVTRDCLIYICAVTILVGVSWDGYIYWYEGLIMVIAFCIYLIVQFNSERFSKSIKRRFKTRKIAPESPPNKEAAINIDTNLKSNGFMDGPISNTFKEPVYERHNGNYTDKEKLCSIPEGNCWSKMFFIYLWPIKVLLFCLVPNPKTAPKLFPLTFIFCVVLIGVNSYVVSWMLTLIGTTLKIPDAILGLSFLAAGGGLPESISIIIMSRRGEGSIGVSNALGANSVNILMSLGFPWFLSTVIKGFDETIQIASGSIHYTILALLLVVCSLFVTLYLNKFRLSRLIGVILSVVYLIFLTLAILSEIFFIKAGDC